MITRNAASQQPFINQLHTLNPRAEIISLGGQVSLLAEVKRLCDDFKRKETSLDLLFLSGGYLPFGGRTGMFHSYDFPSRSCRLIIVTETSEGNESGLSLAHFSRTAFILHLLPLLKASSTNARVISVFAAGFESTDIDVDDLLLTKPGAFGISRFNKTSANMVTLSMENIAQDNPEVVFIHHHPGVVKTDIMKQGWGKKWWGPVLVSVVKPLIGFIALSLKECGERSLFVISSAKFGGKGVVLGEGVEAAVATREMDKGGLFLVDHKMERPGNAAVLRELHEKGVDVVVWKKTMEVLGPFM